MNRRLEIAELDEGTRHEIWESENQTVTVEPWPFKIESFKVGVEFRTVHQLSFSSDQELEKHLLECAVEERTWHFENISLT